MARRPGPPVQPRRLQRLLVGQVARLRTPHRVVLVAVEERRVVGVAGREPARQLLIVVEPAQEGLGRRLVRRVGQEGVRDRIQKVEPALGPLRIHRVVGDLGDLGEIALADHQDRRRVVGAGDLLAEERLVVAHVGPAEHVLEHRLLVEAAAEIDGLGRLVGVDEHGLAVLVDLATAVRPQKRVEPAVVVAEAVTELEAEGMAGLLEQAPGREQVFPVVGELADAGFLEPVGAVHLELADVAPRQRLPLLVDHDRVEDVVVPGTDLLADLGRDVGEVHQARVEEVRPVERRHGDLRSRLRLGDRREPREHPAHARGLVVDLDARELLVVGRQSFGEVVVERLDEGALADDGHGLGRGGGAPGAECGAGEGARGHGQEVATGGHGILPTTCPAWPHRLWLSGARPAPRRASDRRDSTCRCWRRR